MTNWIYRTFVKYPWAEFCMDCETFVYNTAQHVREGHVVVRRVDG